MVSYSSRILTRFSQSRKTGEQVSVPSLQHFREQNDGSTNRGGHILCYEIFHQHSGSVRGLKSPIYVSKGTHFGRPNPQLSNTSGTWKVSVPMLVQLTKEIVDYNFRSNFEQIKLFYYIINFQYFKQ